jgi:hypothetical protein
METRILKEEDEIVAFDDFTNNVNYPNVKNADVLLDQARENFQFVANSVEYLEKKADDLIRYLGLGTGLVGILLNFSFSHLENANKLIVFVGFIAWLISIIFAISIRKTSSYFYPAPVDYAMSFMNKYGDDPQSLKSWIALAYEKSMIRHRITGDKKAAKLNTAYVFLVSALGLFFLSFLLKFISS